MAEYKVTFAYIKGMWYSFPSVESARQAVSKYTGNPESVTYTKPRGVAIQTSLGWSTDGEFADMANWPDQVFAPEGVTGDALWNPPNNPITVETTIVDDAGGGDDTGGDDSGGDDSGGDDSGGEEEEEVDLLDWSAQDEDLVNLAKRYATAGMMARARAAFVKSGGTWSDAVNNALKTGSETKGYGDTIKFDWASLGVDKDMLQTIKDLAKKGKYGAISKLMEGEDGKTTFNKDIHQKLQAFVHMGDKVDWDPVTGQGGDTTVVEEVTKTPKTTRSATTGVGAGGVYDPEKMKGSTAEITGKFKTGEARLDAKEWRARQITAAKKQFGDDPKKMSAANKTAWKKKRDAISNRHKKMIGK